MEMDLQRFAREQGLSDSRVFDTGSGISPLGPSGRVKAAIRKAAKEVGAIPDPGLVWMRRLLASQQGVAPEALFFGNSLGELLCFFVRSLAAGPVLLAGPSLDIHEAAAAAAGAPVSRIPALTSDYTLDAGAAGSSLGAARILLVSNPNRVTGKLCPPEVLSVILRGAAENGATTIVDESLIEFADGGLFSQVADHIRLIVLRTTAHFHGLAGIELAYAAVSPDLAARIEPSPVMAVNHLAVEAARTALRDKTYRRACREYVQDERAAFVRALCRIEGVTAHASDTSVFLAQIDAARGDFRRRLGRAGFLLRDCAPATGLGDRFFRLSVMRHEANLKFCRLLRECPVPARPSS